MIAKLKPVCISIVTGSYCMCACSEPEYKYRYKRASISLGPQKHDACKKSCQTEHYVKYNCTHDVEVSMSQADYTLQESNCETMRKFL